jgi:predicted NACHT family NTPase
MSQFICDRTFGNLLSSYPNSKLPLLVELGRVPKRASGGGDKYSWLKERVPDPIHQELNGTAWHEVSARLQAGNVHVLLDGYDELSKGDRFRVAELLDSLNPNPIVLTSRPAAYHSLSLADMDVYQLQRLQLPQIQRLATEVCAAFASQFRMDTYQQSLALETVLNAAKGQGKYVASNPLLLSFMCLAAIQRAHKGTLSVFPSRPTPLIKECIDTLVVWHREHKIR